MDSPVDGPVLQPIGQVLSPLKETSDVPPCGVPAEIRVYPRFMPALLGLESYSHLWVLCWFHRADRGSLHAVPRRVNAKANPCGVFALRCPNRPNPVALTLTRLRGIDGDVLSVDPLDAVDGTPVIDIKPRTPSDNAFSAVSPFLEYTDPSLNSKSLYNQAINHHGETCDDVALGVRIALEIGSLVGDIRDPGVNLVCETRGCIVDVLQALSGARFGNPPPLAGGSGCGKGLRGVSGKGLGVGSDIHGGY